MAGGRLSVTEDLMPHILSSMLKEVEGVSTASTKQPYHLAELAVKERSPQSQSGKPPSRCRPTSASALSSPPKHLCWTMAWGLHRTFARLGSLLKQELDVVLTKPQAYLQCQYMIISPYPTQICEALLLLLKHGVRRVYAGDLPAKPTPCGANTLSCLHPPAPDRPRRDRFSQS